MQPAKRIRIGDLLVENKLISEAQLMQALSEQKTSGRKLGRTLIDMGFVEENQLLTLLSRQIGIPFIELRGFNFERDVVKRIPETVARRFRVLALKQEDNAIFVAMADPTDIFAYDEVARILRAPIKQAVVRESELLDMMDLAYRDSDDSEIASLAEELHEEIEENAFDLQQLTTAADDTETPVVRLLQKLFEEAVKAKASDIHIEPDEDVVRIRQRIDGVLHEQVMKEKRITSALVVRLKLMSGLDISEKRIPQDGRFNMRVKDRSIDVRLSTMPVQFGESIVMRLADNTAGVISLDDCGMPPSVLTAFRRVVREPHGIVLVTGPTGTGKTTTLYGALSELNTPERKIITVEDPVEYQLPRINQVQVNEKIGLDFAKVLKATLRQDPDVLLVGEIRDRESAEIALRAAMTGHLVMSTLHTNDAISAAMRLIDIGVDGYLVATALRGVIAQRLVRRICENCGADHEPTTQEREWLTAYMDKEAIGQYQFKMGTGCTHCNNMGYRGRIGVFEFLEISEDMADALRKNSISDFKKATQGSNTFKPLAHNALMYAAKGITSVEEVMRVASLMEDV